MILKICPSMRTILVMHPMRKSQLTLAVVTYLLLVSLTPTKAGEANAKPNIVLILSDDQDLTLEGMTPMRQVQQLIGKAGATFGHAYTSSPLCCPSRASLLSGMYAHNHGTTNNSLSGGCNGHRWLTKIEPQALPVLLQSDGGYETFFGGKYLNEFRGERVPPGWTQFYGLHGNSRYYNYTLRENIRNVSYTDTYLTDLLRDKALAFLKTRNKQQPFFAMITPPAPHAPYTPAERHRGAFAHVKALRTPNFNRVPLPQEKHWLVAATRPIPSETVKLLDNFYQQRWETLLAVDEMVAAIVEALTEQQQLDNTYIIYTSDNGYHMGQNAQPWDKRQPYETDIRVPLMVRGPGVPNGVFVSQPTLLLDLMPTILQWTGLHSHTEMDGLPIQVTLQSASDGELGGKEYRRSVLVQHWGEGNSDTYNEGCPWSRKDRLAQCTPESDCHCQDAWNNTYACVRHFRGITDRLYCEFDDRENFVEAYDVEDDPHQINNIGYELLPIEHAFYNLALANLTRCAGSSCNDINL
ncbi:PREDICTED: N-acetylglucosamine-6-sulfatase-like [Rhagoletis zephyria]|uniref:N-acetylglucosamine-6-sulfatase-like n=1 Tax=Rhagoletis zephyria TaxID=28612 RepID=UPI0008113539|nr:PREDICTED: N-acetylglucosamine-6-sulfatase-like [Rhagoletis zephyria]XP_036343028.1 N-acetylglucosamine-6-sulfatase-like [Rhagoletis pomonella]